MIMLTLRRFFLYRWVVTLFGLVYFKVRIHPTATLLSSLQRYKFERGVKLGPRFVSLASDMGIVHFGAGVWTASDVEMNTSTLISIGHGTTIQRHCTINGTVQLGEQCLLAPNVFISSGSHVFRAWPNLPIREQEAKYYALPPEDRPPGFGDMPISIGNDCWLGANVVVLPGVSLGDGCVVGANSVVAKSFSKGCVIVGAPARQVADRFID